RRTCARVWPVRSKARHLTPPVLKSQPVMTVSGGTKRRGSDMVADPAGVHVDFPLNTVGSHPGLSNCLAVPSRTRLVGGASVQVGRFGTLDTISLPLAVAHRRWGSTRVSCL